MNFKLHKALTSTSYAISSISNADFCEQNMPRGNALVNVTRARGNLMDALDALSSYQAEIEAKAKVAA